MYRRCRLCKYRAVDGSMFCADHRRQAETFSVAFGEQDRLAARPPAEHGTAPSPDRLSFDELTRLTFELVAAWVARQCAGEVSRWPLISIYFLNGHWHARPYYAIVPRSGAAPASDRFEWADARRAFAPGQEVYDELARQFEAHIDDLRAHRVQTLDIHFLDYAGLIAINRHTPGETDTNLATFQMRDGSFARVDLGDVRHLIRKPRC